jgi:hypothetical protein
MGIIEEIEKWLEGRGQWWSPEGKNLLIRAVARLRELEGAAHKPEGPSASSVFLDLTKVVVDLRKRIEALEAREEARGGARAAEEVRRPMPKAQPTCPGAREFRSDLDDDMRYESVAE